METKYYKILTFGCQMNLADSGLLAAAMNNHGYLSAATESDADILILNTCSVREKAEERVFGRLGEISALKRQSPALKIAVVGCMAQRLGARILERAPYVDYILGPDRIFDLPEHLAKSNGDPRISTEFGHEKIEDLVPVRDNPFAAYVTISRGCKQYCTYCIVPYVRGEERSYSSAEIINHVNALVAQGVSEITLLGQNVNSYRDNGHDFSDLLAMIAQETDVKRIRFMTSHPRDLSDRLIEIMAAQPKIMSHLHLPLQSGSDRILGKMGRFYNYQHYRSLIDKLRSAVPDISLTTDLIVGFPSETENEYQSTLTAVEEIQFDSAFMFRYSPREGTPAYGMQDDIPHPEKIRRLTKLIELQKKVSHDKNQSEIGKVRSVLVDGFSRRDGSVLKGKTEGNKTILFNGHKDDVGKIKNVRVRSADSWTLHGEVVD